MKKRYSLLLLVVLSLLISCKNKDSNKTVSNHNVQNDITGGISDTNNNNETIPNEIINKYPELKIYSLSSYDKVKNQSTGFISLTDTYPWSDNKDSIAVSGNYLGNKKIPDFHTLNEEYRSRFLNIMKIKETDTVFVYNYRSDSIYKFAVKQAPLLAHITEYGAEPPIGQEDYLIGFDLQKIVPLKDPGSYYDALVYVGTENPFNTSSLKPIVWKKIDTNQFPKEAKKTMAYKSKINKLYLFKMNDLDYYLLNNNHLVILDAKTSKIISENNFIEDESGSLVPLTFENIKNENQPQQWTGNLFKNKPPVFFGFLYASFGCATIDFIETPANRIFISCDNRH